MSAMPLDDRETLARYLGKYGPALVLQTVADICDNRAKLTAQENASLAKKWARVADRIEQWAVDPAIGL